jgi:hypothetical protein
MNILDWREIKSFFYLYLMKTTFIFLFISIAAFSQSKKELRAEIDLLKSQQAQVNLAHQLQIDQLTKKVDSLKSIITRQNDQRQLDQTSISRLREELDKTKDSLIHANNLLTTKQPKKKEEKTKVTTPSTGATDKPFVNPFGSGGSGNGTGMGNNSEIVSGSGGVGRGPGQGPLRLTEVSLKDLKFSKEAILQFKVTIDPDGNVVEITPTQRCTTTDPSIIDPVQKAIREQLKYEKKVGIEMRNALYSIRIKNS